MYSHLYLFISLLPLVVGWFVSKVSFLLFIRNPLSDSPSIEQNHGKTERVCLIYLLVGFL